MNDKLAGYNVKADDFKDRYTTLSVSFITCSCVCVCVCVCARARACVCVRVRVS